MSEPVRVLCVDDEPKVLAALQRTLFEDYDVTTATSGAEAIEILGEERPFAVIVSDMRMPEMNGAAFLARAREVAPDTVRMLLTGHSDMDSAISAINEGNIFRFLCKPCPEPELKRALEAAKHQYALVKAEQQLLEDTLNGAVAVLTQTLSLAAPLAFQRSSTLRDIVDHVAKHVELDGAWQYRMAAMLAPIGCITLPTEVVTRAYAGKSLSDAERDMVARHPEAGRMLLEHIPRLEAVADIVGFQATPPPTNAPEAVVTGSLLLRLAYQVEAAIRAGRPLVDTLREIQAARQYPIRFVASLRTFATFREGVKRRLNVSDLRPGMVIDEDVFGINELLLIGKGRVADEILIRRLRNVSRTSGVKEPFDVLCPA